MTITAKRAFPRHEVFPFSGLLALGMVGLVTIMTETLPAGLLPQISRTLRVSTASTGQLITCYAAGSLIASIPLTILTSRWRRRRVILLSISGLCLFNVITALSTTYIVALSARSLAGMMAGLAWGVLVSHARRMVPEHQKGRATAIALVGAPIALSIGVPIATFLGRIVDWRFVFLMMSAFSIVLSGWVMWKVPDFTAQSAGTQTSMSSVLKTPGVSSVLTVLFLWMFAHNMLYTYITPFLSHAGLSDAVDRTLLVFGISATLGTWLVGLYVDRLLRSLVLVSLTLFAVSSVAITLGEHLPVLVIVAMAVWGGTFGGAATLIQTACAIAAGPGADLAPALVVTIWNFAIGMGGAAGGILISKDADRSFPVAIVLSLSVALLITWRRRRYGFPAHAQA